MCIFPKYMLEIAVVRVMMAVLRGRVAQQIMAVSRLNHVLVHLQIQIQPPPLSQPPQIHRYQPIPLLLEVVVKTNGVLVQVVLKVARLIINPLVLAEVAVVIPMIVPMVQLNLAAKRLRLLPPPQIHRYQPIPLPPHLLTSHPRVITMGWIVLT
ncbi:hypothetical protein COW99_02745 [Candidatus Roizmanbacteria bacterium CG22_combo_CG10-13_8_21_14_all_38_20]|uniref:Uncharacterized protein n=1 Tax=Candidatus Roizmanbacteria bacterium CG22_combo_CG10-13_8_21_14_all_38_20 TaxID=1974862 RepID=A0A2H0BVG1_9BACT|nr:MAG: hypothetical protein COW99_02745 [Candidatus Roizmanbacteria bacterium CG22_combo_CG10-13_8_21_14_all_38_20]PJC31370.1 MAG: hypothetical protein CO050_03285 [Candidatus Roizmanbacteria bacterium CG_4_9_14_0_2_um_filter_38_17]